jgi:hypothetical protein
MITFTVVKPGAVLSKVKEPTSQPELPFLSDFETGSLEGWSKELCCDTSAQVITNPVRTGHYAVQFSLNQTDKDIQGSKRAELTLGKLITPANAERWYGFSIYLPASYVPDLSSEIVAQWHEVPDFTLGENWRTPPLALKTVDGRWQISNRWDPNPLTKKNTPGPGGGQANTPLEPYTTNQWTDWVFHIKWSSEANGLLEVWQDRRLVLRKVGPNTYNDQTGPYFKIGLYKPDWKYRPAQSVTTNRQIIFDEIRVGDQTANFAPPNPP